MANPYATEGFLRGRVFALQDALRALIEANNALLQQVDALEAPVPLKFIPLARAVAEAEEALKQHST